MRNYKLALPLVLTFIISSVPVLYGQGTADAQLQEYMQELRSSEVSYTVRRPIFEKIIKLVAGMKTPPQLSADAEKHGFRAEYMAKSAKSAEDFQKAADEYYEAILLAPWVAQYYENMGLALDGAGALDTAKDKFELYLIAAPDASDRTEVRKKIAELEVRMEQAAVQKKSDEAEADKHLLFRRFRSATEGKTFYLYECNGRGHRGCTWSEFYDGGVRQGQAVWTDKGTFHWIFVDEMAYLVAVSSGDDIRSAQVRVVNRVVTGNGYTNGILYYEMKNGRTGEWEDDHYVNGINTDYDKPFLYSVDAPTFAAQPENAKKINFYYLLASKPL